MWVSGNLRGKQEAIAACRAGTGVTPNANAAYLCLVDEVAVSCECSTTIEPESPYSIDPQLRSCGTYDFTGVSVCCHAGDAIGTCSCESWLCETDGEECRCSGDVETGTEACSPGDCCSKPGEYCRCGGEACTADESPVLACGDETFSCGADRQRVDRCSGVTP
jgi:hypothetical protein